MKRIIYAAMTTMSALVLLFGYHTSTSSRANAGAPVAISGGSSSTASASSPTSAGTGQVASSAGSPPTGASSSSSRASSAAKTVTGTAADTRYGPVQVQLTVQNGKVTNVSVIQYPNNDSRDQEINAQALPILISETISAQSAGIDMVSGATYTSQGYLTSLQSALDQAGI